MGIKLKYEWEKIHHKGNGSSYRLQVPGGWIVKSSYWSSDGAALAQIFIADPKHEWEFKKPEPKTKTKTETKPLFYEENEN